MISQRHRIVFLVLLMLSFRALLPAQSINGSMLGTVKDSQGSVVPGAQVGIVNMDTGQSLKTQTDATGNYMGFPLPAGKYDVRASSQGFQSTTVSGVRLDLDSRVRVDVVLQLATVQESVTVEATGAALIQTATSSLESVVENKQIVDLPLNGRNINDLVYLTPGTMENTTNGGLGDFVADGNRPWGNTFLIDGISNRNELRGMSSLSISVDAVQEFKVKKSNASAEFGGAGSTVTLAVKSGTNQLHGSLFEFNRSKLGEARDFFNPGNDLPPFLRNQFGGSLGGPIRRDRTFFFVNYEGSRITSSQGQLSSVPTAQMRSGDFRGIVDVAGKPLTLAAPTPLPFTLTTGQPLFSAPNVINPFYLADSASNPNRANARIANAVLAYYVLPNLPGMVNNLASVVTKDSSSKQFTARVDHRLSDKHSVSFRFTSSDTTSGGGNQVAPSLSTSANPYQRNTGASLISSLRPTLINELRVGMQSGMSQNFPSPARDFVKEFGIPEPVPLPQVPAVLNRIPTFSFLGNGQFNRIQYTSGGQFGAYGGDNTPMQEGNDNVSLADTLTWHKGSHEWKTGYQVNYIPILSSGTPASRGSLSYNGKANALSSGYSVADALIGVPAGTQFVLFPSDFHLRVWQQAAFLQDDWRVSNRLTLNLGVRWDVRPPATETDNLLASFDLALGKMVVASPGGKISDKAYPLLLQRFANSFVTATQAGWDERRLLQTNWNDWGPRIGFALRLDRNSSFVLRGSYGIFYSFSPYYTLANFTGGSGVPFSLTSQVNTSAADQLTNQNPFRAMAAGTQTVNGIERVNKDNNNQQLNVTLERAVLRESTVSVSFVGNRGAHLLGTFNHNIAKPKAYPDFGDIKLSNAVSNSWYNAMQVEFRRRYSRGLFYQINWTWAKSIDDVSQGTGGQNLDVIAVDRRLNRADSDFVRRHTVRMNALYELPIGRKHHLGTNWHPVLDALVGGWSLGGIVSLNTGQFTSPTVQGGAYTARPDRVLDVPISLSDADRKRLAQQTGDSSYLDPTKRWFNPLAFRSVDAAEGRVGNAGRNTILGPNFFGADVSLSKRFHLPKLPERASALIRAEAFNVLNHPNFGVGRPTDAALNAIINSNNAGAFTRTLNSPRQFQFAIRLDF
jgi:hypothetical protein